MDPENELKSQGDGRFSLGTFPGTFQPRFSLLLPPVCFSSGKSLRYTTVGFRVLGNTVAFTKQQPCCATATAEATAPGSSWPLVCVCGRSPLTPPGSIITSGESVGRCASGPGTALLGSHPLATLGSAGLPALGSLNYVCWQVGIRDSSLLRRAATG